MNEAGLAAAARSWAPVGVLAAGVAGVLAWRAGRYDWFGDELYFVAAGRHPAFGYADQGPLVPLIGRAAELLAPGSRVAARLPAVLAAAAGVLVAAGLAREFGGSPRARLLAAFAAATCPFLITQSASLSTFAFDATLTALLLWCVVRGRRVVVSDGRPESAPGKPGPDGESREGRGGVRLRPRRARHVPAEGGRAGVRARRALLAGAVVVAVAVQVKALIVVVLAGLAVGLAVCGPRRISGPDPGTSAAATRTDAHRAPVRLDGTAPVTATRPGPAHGVARRLARVRTELAAAGIVAVSAAPVLWWQAAHGWPQAAMGAVVRDEQRAAMGGVAGLPWQLVAQAGPLGTLLAGYGLWLLVTGRDFRAYRFVTVAFVISLGFVIVAGGRPYYLAGWQPLLFAAGAVGLTRAWERTGPTRRRWDPVRGAVGSTAVASVAIVVAVLALLPRPVDAIDHDTATGRELSTRLRLYGTTGWNHLVDTVAAAYRDLPAGDRAHTAIVTENYWQAAALTVLGPPGLPAALSPNRGFADLGTPDDRIRTIVSVTAGDPACAAACAHRDGRDPVLHTLFRRCVTLRALDIAHGFPGIDRGVTVWRCDDPLLAWPELWRRAHTVDLDSGL
ncbi:glycosyltransferase family 39 protein [Nocardia thailandica]|uniref:glycosyltransferase family 39 protein n=1 Tax=Nocardia thailandica TaxID=257275 RepID=UPI00030006B0|nr:glycosyltransferase family 39 protein [Nocardia thailandica]